jgi:hypothetical protein
LKWLDNIPGLPAATHTLSLADKPATGCSYLQHLLTIFDYLQRSAVPVAVGVFEYLIEVFFLSYLRFGAIISLRAIYGP